MNIIPIIIILFVASCIYELGGWVVLAICSIMVATFYLITKLIAKKTHRDDAKKKDVNNWFLKTEQETPESRRKSLGRELSHELLPLIEKYTHDVEPTSAIKQLISYCNIINEWHHRFRVAITNTKSKLEYLLLTERDPPFYRDGRMSEIADFEYPTDWQTIDLSRFDRMAANYFTVANKAATPEELLEKKLRFIAEFVTDHAKNLSGVITKYLEEGEKEKQQ